MAYVFYDKHGYGEPFTAIHPFKQAAVKHMVDNVLPEVTHVIVFGSSTLPCCRSWSDIDVCLIGNLDDSLSLKPLRSTGESYDFLKYRTLKELKDRAGRSIQNVEKSILDMGVLVYEQ